MAVTGVAIRGQRSLLRQIREALAGGGPAQAHDLADQAFAALHAGQVDGAGVQAFGGEQLHFAGRAAQIERADFGDHGARDDPHHHVQTRLRRAAPGKGLPYLPKQTALTADSYARCRHLLAVPPNP